MDSQKKISIAKEEAPPCHRPTIHNIKIIDDSMYTYDDVIDISKTFDVLDIEGTKNFTIQGIEKLLDSILQDIQISIILY